MTTSQMKVQGADSTQKVCQKLYSAQNAATLAAMQDKHQLDIRRAHRPANPLTKNPDIQMHTNGEGEAEAPPVWVDLKDKQPHEIDELIAADKEKYRQQAHHFNWGVLLKHLLAQFMTLQIKTKNWTTNNGYNDFTKCSKNCKIKFKRLLEYLAGLPVKPQTAFSIPLLTFFDCLWNNCHMASALFTTALNQWLEPLSQQLCVCQGKHGAPQAFLSCRGSTRQIRDQRVQTVISALQLSKQEILASQTCPACFGPQPPNLCDYPANIRGQPCVCLDGNFQHRHQINASCINHDRIHTAQFFISQIQVDWISQEIRALEAEGMDPVQAADNKRNETTWKGCDDTDLMGCCCQHNAAIHFANIYKSGEEQHFPMALIQTLLSEIEPNQKEASRLCSLKLSRTKKWQYCFTTLSQFKIANHKSSLPSYPSSVEILVLTLSLLS
ncbi:hypothetical protein PSTG_02796 [Puccinia striiformis f. sp. tritici PST-78]|uniref:CxC1-like cysteine cluster associated with KDZ transposases domain-containing protein n=1 Tax=Puccinia striiformis f. sp. tritici PST-78 TaxID=1165861 RepID=A0A0L0VY33_9BASI|nr:hypothetical protein PSTG_02796 [Puccinia striiformis f. sp. tritici PST-78]